MYTQKSIEAAVVTSLLMILCGVFITPVAHAARASGTYDNANIARGGLQYLHQYYGQCWTFARDMIYKASNGTQDISAAAGGGDYFAHLQNAGGTPIAYSTQLSEGDIVQIGEFGNDLHLHTFIIVGLVSGNTFTVVDANYDTKGNVFEYQRPVTLGSNERAFRFGTVAGGSSSSLRIGVLTNGSYLVKENNLSAQWTDEYDGVTQGVLSGSLIGVLLTNGTFQVKQGGLSTPWTNEYSGVKAIALSDASNSTPLRIGVLTNGGSFLVKEGSLSAQWTDEYDGVTEGYLSGSRIGVLTNSGSLLVKDGSLSASWTDEYDSVAHGFLSGSLIGILTPNSTFLVKQGGLSAPWTNEYSGVVSASLSDTTSTTAFTIGVLTTSGSFLAKQGNLSAQWTDEYDAVEQGTISGDLIGVLLTNGTFMVKQGGLSTPWTSEYSNVLHGSLWSL